MVSNRPFNKHGLRKHPLYIVWHAMRSRCLKPHHPSFKNYGARGIVICSEWITNIGAFIEWSEANGWQKGLTIDRIDNDGNYTPENCRYATRKVQNNNYRKCLFVEFDGKKMTLTQCVDNYSQNPYQRVQRRIKSGWSLIDAITKPVISPVGNQNRKGRRFPKGIAV